MILTAPVLLVVIVRRKDLATRDRTNCPCDRVDDGVAHDTSNQAVRDRVRERHEHERDKGWDAVTGIVPVDSEDTAHHHAANEHQRTTSSPRWDRGKDGSEEERDEEENTGSDGCKTCATSFLNTSTRLNEGSDGRGSEQRTDRDGDGIGAVRDSALGEVTRLRIDNARETSHGVQSTRSIENVNIKHSEDGQRELSTDVGQIPVLGDESVLDRVERNDVLEELETAVPDNITREEGDAGVAGPREDRDKGDTEDHGTTDLVGHQKCSKDTSDEEPEPHSGVGSLVRETCTSVGVTELCGAASQFKGSGLGSGDGTNTGTGRETDQGEEESDTSTASNLDRGGDDTCEPLTDSEERQGNEDETFNEDSSHGDTVVDRTSSVETNNLVGEVGIETHSRGNSNWKVGADAHEERSERSDGGGGGNEVAVNLNEAEIVFVVGHTGRVDGVVADTCTTGVSED